MEDGATGVKLANATKTVLNSSKDLATGRHPGPEEDVVQDPTHEKVNTAPCQYCFKPNVFAVSKY